MTIRWKVAQFFEVNWWKHYLKNKKPATYLAQKKAYWKKFLSKLDISFEEKDEILIAGCGPSGIYMALEKGKIDAIDPLLKTYEVKLPHFRKEKYPKITFQQTTIENLGNQKKYNTVFCLNVINHVTDIHLAMDVLADSTRPNGIFVLSIDTHNTKFFKQLFRFIPYLDILHPHQFDLEEYQMMVRKRGFKIEKTILMKERSIFNYHALVARKVSYT